VDPVFIGAIIAPRRLHAMQQAAQSPQARLEHPNLTRYRLKKTLDKLSNVALLNAVAR
jgi:hypothetical protein